MKFTTRMPALRVPEQFERGLNGGIGAEELMPSPNRYLPSKRVNSSKADKDDTTLINKVELSTTQ